jgi:Family of unknown function (DUF5906)
MMNQKSETPSRQGQGSQIERSSHAPQNLLENSAPVNSLESTATFAPKVVMAGFRPWHKAGFISELLPIIRVDATLTDGSTVRETDKGKVPGIRTQAGTWSGLGGSWSNELQTTGKDLPKWHGWGAGVGMQGRKFPGLDIDVDDPKLAGAVERLAVAELAYGAPVRFRAGSPRLLFMLKSAEPMKVVRLPFWTSDGRKQVVELLCKGQQYVVAGTHPKGGEYEWRPEAHPCDLGPPNIPEITLEDVDRFFAALRALLIERGCTLGNEASTAGTLASGSRKRIGDASMAAPSPQHVLDLLAATPCTGERFKDRHDIVAWLCGVKAALGEHHEEHRPAVLEWFLEYPGAEEAYFDKIWESVIDSAVGWDWLAAASGTDIAAQVEFANPPEIADEDLPEAPEGEAQKAARKRMFSNTVYISSVDRFGDWETGDLRDAKALCVLHRGVAEVGARGTKSADNIFLNHPSARIVDTITYRPGKAAIVDEEVNGTLRKAFNIYRPSSLKPAAGVTDADVSPWLNLWTKIFGARGTLAYEHALNWMAFVLQKPGKKPNHCLVVVGPEGVGKDSVFEPVRRGAGKHNIATISARDVTGPQNDFWAQKQLVFINEVNNFTRRETMDTLKPYVAAPPDWLTINGKYVRQYQVPNLLAIVMFSNHTDALALKEREYTIEGDGGRVHTPVRTQGGCGAVWAMSLAHRPEGVNHCGATVFRGPVKYPAAIPQWATFAAHPCGRTRAIPRSAARHEPASPTRPPWPAPPRCAVAEPGRSPARCH